MMMTAKFNTKPATRQSTRGMLLARTGLCGALLLAGAACFAARPAAADPAGGAVVQGGATIQSSGAHTEITQTTQQTLITWQDFSIGAAESVNFAQPNTSAVAVNKVVTDIPSDIQGQLTANGQVWIINPNGIFIGKDAAINVGGLIASTAGLVEQDWNAGSYTFNGAPAGSKISNQGTITAIDGSIVLVAPIVDSSGRLAAAGDVALGAGSGFTVDFHGDGLTRFAVDGASGAKLNVSGTISAQGGAAYLMGAATDAVEDAVVSIGGQVEATRIEERGGVIVIAGGDSGVTEISGTIDASQDAGAGGNVTISGGRVALTETAVIDASGVTGGGTVEIGGGFQGAALSSDVASFSTAPDEAPLPTAKRTYVAEGAQIAANAGAAGDGGTVIVWSDEITAFYGDLSATGGATSGNGGFAEVSGKDNLAFDGTFDLTAPAGEVGELLLDPNDITIVWTGSNDTLLADDQVLFGEPDDLANISISASALNSASDITLQANGDIIVDYPVNNVMGGGLTFEADNDIDINLSIQSNGFLDFTANFDSAGGGSVVMDSRGGELSGTNITLAGDSIVLADIDATGNLTVTARAGSITDDDAGNAAGADVNVAGSTSLSATGAITLDDTGTDFGGAVSANGTSITLHDANSIVLGDIEATATTGALTITANLDVTDNAGDQIKIAGTTKIDVTGDINIDNTSAHEFAGTVSLSGDQVIDFNSADDVSFTKIEATNASAESKLSTSDGGKLDFNGNVFAFDFRFAADGDVTQTSGTITTGKLTLDGSGSGTDFITLNGANVVTSLATGSTRVGTINFTDSDGLILAGIEATNLTLTVGGNLSDSGTVDVTGTTVISAGSASVTLDHSNNDFADDGSGKKISVTGGAVTLTDKDSINLGAILATSLTVSATGGKIVDTSGDAITVTGATTLTAFNGTDTYYDITLDNPNTHDFDADDDGTATTAAGSLNGLGGDALTFTGENVTLVDKDRIVLGASMANGDISVTADDVEIGALVTADSGNGTITFMNADGTNANMGLGTASGGATTELTNGFDMRSADFANLSADTVRIDNDAGNGSGVDVPYIYSSGLDTGTGFKTLVLDTDTAYLGRSASDNFQGNLSIEADLLIAQNSVIVVDGATTLGVFTEGTTTPTGSITLNNPANDFRGTVNAAAGSASLSDSVDLKLGDIDVTGDLTVTAGLGSITDDGDGASAGDDIDVAGMTTLDAGTSIVLDDIHNDFQGTVDVAAVNVSLADANDLTLGDINASGNLTVTAAAGTITDDGDGASAGDDINVNGMTSLSASGNIVLDDIHNNFSGTVNAAANSVSLTDANDLTLGDIDATGNLTVTAGATITDDGDGASAGDDIDVAGVTSLSASGNIVLDDIHNDSQGTLNASGANITLTDTNSIVLGDIDATGNLTVTAHAGSITDDDAGNAADADVNVAGSTSLSATGAITLDDTGTDFDSDSTGDAVDAEGTSITLRDANSIVLGDIDATGNLTVTAGAGSITDDGDGASAGDDIDVAGVTSLIASGVITLDDIQNDFDTDNSGDQVDATAVAITLLDRDAIVLGAITATSLSVTARGGSITDTAGDAIVVTGATTLTAFNGTDTYYDITLDNPGLHDFDASDSGTFSIALLGGGGSTLAFTGENVTLVDRDRIVLGASTANGDISVTAADVEIAGLVTADSGKGTITFMNVYATSTTMGLGTFFGNASAEVTTGFNMTNTDLSRLSARTVRFDNDAGGSWIASSGLDTGTGFKTLALDTDTANLGWFGADLVRGNLSIEADSLITQKFLVTVLGETTLGVFTEGTTTPTGSITLNNPANDFQGTVSAAAGSASLADANDLTLGDIDVTGALTIAAGGIVTREKGAQFSVGGEFDFGTTILRPSWRAWTKRSK